MTQIAERTLYTSDYLEYYSTLVGWIVHNGIWNTLVATSLIAVPFFVIVIQEWLRARAEGADEGNKGMLSAARVENRVWVAIVVILLAGIPVVDVDMATVKFNTTRSEQCQVKVPLPEETGWGKSFTTLNRQSARVPLWWFFMHAASKAVTGAAVAAIPCGTDLRQMRMEIDSTRISDPVLAQELSDFSKDCYGPARAKLFMHRPEVSDAQLNDIAWIGSRYFLNSPGFYDSYHARTPRSGWPYDAQRDAGLAQVPSGAGYPTCSQWWSDRGRGLRTRLLAQVDPDLLSRMAGWASFMSRDAVDDSVIREIASPRKQIMNRGDVYADYGGQIGMTDNDVLTRVIGGVGVTVGSVAAFPAMDAVRQAVPMVVALLKLALVISLSIVLVIGLFELRVVVSLSAVFFAIYFVEFWFELARWLDSTVLNALYGLDSPHMNFNPVLGLNNAYGDLTLNYVMGAMFIILPTFWVGALAWAGISVGRFLEGMTAGSSGVRAEAAKGADRIASAASAAVTAGKKLG